MTFNAVQYYEYGKGRGIIAPIFEPEYQAVLDYATANSITTPPLLQNIKNNAIVKNLKNENVWQTRDLFYYGKYNYTTDNLQNFSQLNWVDPTKYRLYNNTPSLVPTYVDNFGWKHNADGKFWKTGWTPKTNAVYTTPDNVGVFFKLFDYPTIYSTYNRIFGCRLADNISQLYLHNSSEVLYTCCFETQSSSTALITPFIQSEINSHYAISKDNIVSSAHPNIIVSNINKLQYINNNIKDVKTFQSGTFDTADYDLVLLGLNQAGVYYGEGVGGIEYFSIGSEIRYNVNEIYNIMVGSGYFDKKVNTEGTIALTSSQITLPTIYWLTPYLSSDFPTITTTKQYILLWSTDHDSGAGGIYWGECDDLDFNGFIERGKIIDGYQAETPLLFLYPNDVDGHIIHLYYHTTNTDPSNVSGTQETHYMTTAGGLLHNPIWTDRGKPLGMINTPVTENHTGYLIPHLQDDNSIVGIHLSRGFTGGAIDTINRYGKSVSTDGRNWTRESSYMDGTSYMPYFRVVHIDQGLYFKRNGNQYLICVNSVWEMNYSPPKRISIFGCDGQYYPKNLIGNISVNNGGNGMRTLSLYLENDIVHIYYTSVGSQNAYHTTWNLSNLDNQTLPDAITDLSVVKVYSKSIRLSWTEPNSINGVIYYEIYVNGVFNKSHTKLEGTVFGLVGGNTYAFTVLAVDNFNNRSLVSNTITQQINGTLDIISEYKFEDTVLDSAGNNDGVPTNITYVNGLVGKASVYNGLNSKVSIPNTIGTTLTEMSFSCLIKTIEHTPTDALKTGLASTCIGSLKSHYPFTDGNIYLELLTNTRKTIGVGIIADRTVWHHITVTVNTVTDVWKFYQNGTLVHTDVVGGLTIKSPIYLGYGDVGASATLNGYLDCVRFWDKELTQTEITSLSTDELNGIDINP